MTGFVIAGIAAVVLVAFLLIKIPKPSEEDLELIFKKKAESSSGLKASSLQARARNHARNTMNSNKVTDLLVQVMEDGSVSEIQKAMENGINLRQKLELNQTLLMIAVKNNPSTEVIRFLLHQGIEINDADDNGQTALMIATTFNPHPEIIMELLNNGADKTLKDKNGKTAADYIIMNSALTKTEIPDLLKIE